MDSRTNDNIPSESKNNCAEHRSVNIDKKKKIYFDKRAKVVKKKKNCFSTLEKERERKNIGLGLTSGIPKREGRTGRRERAEHASGCVRVIPLPLPLLSPVHPRFAVTGLSLSRRVCQNRRVARRRWFSGR